MASFKVCLFRLSVLDLNLEGRQRSVFHVQLLYVASEIWKKGNPQSSHVQLLNVASEISRLLCNRHWLQSTRKEEEQQHGHSATTVWFGS